MFFPKGADVYFDVLYSVASAVFFLDIILNIFVDPEYIAFHLCRRKGDDTQNSYWTCGIGSFMFWCDVVSSLALLYDISYINKHEFEMLEISIVLDNYGVPVS